MFLNFICFVLGASTGMILTCLAVDPIGISTGGMYAKGQSITTSVVTLSAQTTIYGATNMSQSTSYTYTESGVVELQNVGAHMH